MFDCTQSACGLVLGLLTHAPGMFSWRDDWRLGSFGRLRRGLLSVSVCITTPLFPHGLSCGFSLVTLTAQQYFYGVQGSQEWKTGTCQNFLRLRLEMVPALLLLHSLDEGESQSQSDWRGEGYTQCEQQDVQFIRGPSCDRTPQPLRQRASVLQQLSVLTNQHQQVGVFQTVSLLLSSQVLHFLGTSFNIVYLMFLYIN